MQKEQLIEVILRLLGAWGDPLTQLYWSMTQDQNQDFNHFGSNKALEISDIVHELRDGVAKMVEKVRIHAWLLICCVVISNSDLICLVIWRPTCNVKLYSVFDVFVSCFCPSPYCMHLHAAYSVKELFICCLFSFCLPQMKLLGVLGNTVGYISPESWVPSSAFSFYKQRESYSLDHHDLLYCFRRDSNKVKNYLRILKCTTLPGLGC